MSRFFTAPLSPRLVAPALLIAVGAISFAAIFFRLAAPTHPLVAAGLRLAIAAAILSPWTIRALYKRRLPGKTIRLAVIAGLLYGVHFGAWVASLNLTTIAASVTLVTTNPLILAVVGTLTGRDRPHKRLWIALALAFIGLLLIGGADWRLGSRALLGDALALLGALAMSGYLLVGRSLGESLDVWSFSGIATAVGAIVLLGGAGALGIAPLAASWHAFGFLVLAAILPQLVGHTLLTWSLRHAPPSVVAMAVVGEPVGATFLGWLLLGENVTGFIAAGCLITLIAVLAAIAQQKTARTI
ncbi:MAG TPA: DMT family transporter [bacterium]|nr:DMT family transporter [bacterium]